MASHVSVNPYTGFRAVPIDPESRLPEGGEVLATGIQYDFGAARPHRILKAVPGARGQLDREATMRANLHTVDGDERELGGTWGQDPRGLSGSSGGGGGRRPGSAGGSRRPGSAVRHRSDTNRQNSGSRTTTRAGRSAGTVHSAMALSDAQMAQEGLTQHLSNLDIGAGTPGDSMVTQFPLYKTPLVHPYLPSAAVASQILASTDGGGQPMDPAMFAAAVSELRGAAAAVAPRGPVVRSRAEVERMEREERLKREAPGGFTAQKSKEDIQSYQAAAKELEKRTRTASKAGGSASSSAAGGSSSSRHTSARAERERSKYHARVAKLEAQLASLSSDAERRAAREAWEAAEKKYKDVLTDSASGAKKTGLADDPLDDGAQYDEFGLIPPSSPRSLHAHRLASVQRGLARGEVVSEEFRASLEDLRTSHAQNLAQVEDLFYAQKLTGQLGSTLLHNSQQQMDLLAAQQQQQQQQQLGSTQARRSGPGAGGAAAQLPLRQSAPTGDLSRVTDPRELSYAMSQSAAMRRDPRQARPGVTDPAAGADALERADKMRLAAAFEPSEAGSVVGGRRVAHGVVPRRSAAGQAALYEDDDEDDDDRSSVSYDAQGRPLWREVPSDDDRALDARDARAHAEAQDRRQRRQQRDDKEAQRKEDRRRREQREADEESVTISEAQQHPARRGGDRHSARSKSRSRSRSRSPRVRSRSRSRSPRRGGSDRKHASKPQHRSSRSRSNSRSRSRSRSPQRRRDARGRSHSRSRSRSPRRRSGSRSRSRSPSRSRSRSPRPERIQSSMSQPRAQSASQKNEQRHARHEQERRDRRDRRHHDNGEAVDVADTDDRHGDDEREHKYALPDSQRDIAPEVDDGVHLRGPARPQTAQGAGARPGQHAHSAGRPSTANAAGRSGSNVFDPHARTRSGSRPRTTSAAYVAPVDVNDAFPRSAHNAREIAAARRAAQPINQAHAFGPGRPIVDEERRPITGGQGRARSASRTRASPSPGAEGSDSDNAAYLGRSGRVHHVTEPEPFGAAASPTDGSVPASRTKQRFLEYLGEVRAREEAHLSTSFKANPLPTTTMQPLYNQMVKDARKRSKQIRRERKSMTESLVKPFEFAATKAMEKRKRAKLRAQRRKQGLPVSDTSSSDSGSETEGSQSETSGTDGGHKRDKKKNKHKKKKSRDSDDGTAVTSETGGNDSDAATETTDATDSTIAGPPPVQYKVVFGVTTRVSPPPSAIKQQPQKKHQYSSAKDAAPVPPPFKANKIPWTSQAGLLDAIVKEREAAREERVKERARQLLEQAALPSRMEEDKKRKEAAKAAAAEKSGGNSGISGGEGDPAAEAAAAALERRRKKKFPPAPTYKPELNTSVPDFARLHAEFAADLDKVKRSYETTRLAPFNITANKSKPVEFERPPQFKAKPYIPSVPPEGSPPSTKKTDMMTEKARARLAEREERERLAEEARQAALKHNGDMARKLIPKIAATHSHGLDTTTEAIKKLVRAKNKELKQADAEWAERVDAMKARVRDRPLLVESYNNAAGRIEARKRALLAIKESLDKAGIEDQSKFFDPQELADLDLKF